MIVKGPTARYDDALPRFVALVVDCLGEDALNQHAFLRDAEGTLTLIQRAKIAAPARRRIEKAAKENLGTYAAALPLATPEELIRPELRRCNT